MHKCQNVRCGLGSPAMSTPPDDAFVALVEDYLAGLQAAKRSTHTVEGYRYDLLGVAARIARDLHGAGAGVIELRLSELDQRALRRGFAA